VSASRAVQLVRVSGLRAAHRAIAALACAGGPHAGRRAVLVPTRRAAWHLRRTLDHLLLECAWRPSHEDLERLGVAPVAAGAAAAQPALLTRDEWLATLVGTPDAGGAMLSDLEREVILRAACRDAVAAGIAPPFTLRPGLLGSMLSFYDALRRHRRTVDDLDRVVGTRLEDSAETDRGAARLLAQTRFLSAAFRGYEQRLAASGRADEHRARERLLDAASPAPGTSAVAAVYAHLVVTLADQAGEPGGLWPCDIDLLLRLPGLARVDIVATEEVLGAGLHERLLVALPGVGECRPRDLDEPPPVLVAPPRESGRLHFVARDRESELGEVASRLRAGTAAVVFQRPLPYLYLAQQHLGAIGVPFQAEDALPLAAEPYTAALDLLLDAVASPDDERAREALARSPHLRFAPGEVAALAGELRALPVDATVAQQLDRLMAFLDAHALPAGEGRAGDTAAGGMEGSWEVRQRRARGAVFAILRQLRDAHRQHDDVAAPASEVGAVLRRWIEAQTFAPQAGTGGLHLVDATTARFGRFDGVHLLGLVEGDWPEPPSRSVLYPGWLLRDLGWPPEAPRRLLARAAFVDLLRLAARETSVSTFLLEHDAIVAPAMLLEDIDRAALAVHRQEPGTSPGAAGAAPATSTAGDRVVAVASRGLGERAAKEPAPATWRAMRRTRTPAEEPRFHGAAGEYPRDVFSVTSLEAYADCPFRYFSSRVLRLEEERPDTPGLDPRRWGTLVHGVFERFFGTWSAGGEGAITAASLDAARAMFESIVDAEILALPPADRGVERTRLLGSAASPGIGERALRLEASRAAHVVERRLEWDLSGTYEVPAPGGARRLALRGIADRIDLLADGTLRVLDYKTGRAPDRGRALQLPVYGWCAEQRLDGHRGRRWRLAEASYLAFGERQPWSPVIAAPEQRDEVVARALRQLVETVDAITRGAFPPRPAERRFCATCGFAAACRKDYVDGA
jgi:hypothetical protein